jgi:hypothetical protein
MCHVPSVPPHAKRKQVRKVRRLLKKHSRTLEILRVADAVTDARLGDDQVREMTLGIGSGDPATNAGNVDVEIVTLVGVFDTPHGP